MANPADVPLCPICTDTLGKFGGPVTLPCGHNGCLDCMASVKTHNAQCPLCRTPFDTRTSYQVNHELKDLINLATSLYRLDEKSKRDGWEAFPTSKLTTEHYAIEYKHDYIPFSSGDVVPTAPSLEFLAQSSMHGDPDILNAEPPRWLPDSYASHCGNCHLPFKALVRLRHHCRMCGKIFCNSCCHKRLQLPPKFGKRDPERVCELCSGLLLPFQQYLAGIQSRAMQPPIHDATDGVSLRSWINLPYSSNMESELYKASNILDSFISVPRMYQERSVPSTVLQGARGLAILSVFKDGGGISQTFGTGIMLSRLPNGQWSAPCAVACAGLGWGFQLGTELTDLLLVLRSDNAIKVLCGSMVFKVGGTVSAALGPLGRTAEAAFLMGDGGCASCCAYSCSKGAFLGVSLDAFALWVRSSVNLAFYGYPVKASQLLQEMSVPQPPAASLLYSTLARVMQQSTGIEGAHANHAITGRPVPMLQQAPVIEEVDDDEDDEETEEFFGHTGPVRKPYGGH